MTTTPEQSKRLLELGLDPRTSDAHWKPQSDGYVLIPEGLDSYQNASAIPAWSLSALLKLMPEIRTEYGIMQPYLVSGAGRRFRFLCFYKITYNTQNYDEPVDAAYEMVVWLLENGYIKNDTVSGG